MALDPKCTIALYNLAVLESLQDPITAINLCRKAHALSPRDPNVRWNLGLLFHQRAKVTEGRKYLNDAIRTGASLGEIAEERDALVSAEFNWQRTWVKFRPKRTSATPKGHVPRSQPELVSPLATVRRERTRRRQSGGAQARMTAARSARAASSG